MPNVLCEEAKSAVAVRLLPAASVVPGRREPAHVVQMWLHMRLPRAKKQHQAFTPLGQQLNSVYEYKRADRASAMCAAATTVFPNAVGAHSTPVSYLDIAAAAAS